MTTRPPAPTMKLIPARGIHLERKGWDLWLLRYRLRTAHLEPSVTASGVIEPVVVERWQNGYRIIAGFARAATAKAVAADSVPAVVFPKGTLKARDGYLMAVASNAPGASLSDLDRAVALAKGRARFRFAEKELASTVAPLLGLPPSVKVVRQYIAIAGLPHSILDTVADGRISRQHAEAILLVPEKDREVFFVRVVSALGLSASETRIFAEGILDLAARDKRRLSNVMTDVLPTARDASGKPHPAQKLGQLARETLRRRLSPIVTEMEDEFSALILKLSLPPGAKLHNSPGFESDELALAAKIADTASLTALKATIERGLADGTFDRLFSIASRKTREIIEKSRTPGT